MIWRKNTMIKDNQLLKALQLFASKSKKGRVTDRVAHIKDGLLTITDAHKLIQKSTWLPDMDIDLFNLSKFEGTYIEDSTLGHLTKIDGLLPNKLDHKIIAYLYSFVKNHKRSSDKIHLIQEDRLLVSAYDDDTREDMETIKLDPTSKNTFEYIFDASNLFAALNYLQLTEIPVTLYTGDNKLAPIVLYQNSKTNVYENAKIVLAPIRVY
ncbi:unknown [Lactobacillus phage Lb338-1]|uniref:Uncharacterized protein n=1 Tax=Lactobacillus phage Lb338-1 TaxID=2892342 RepID=C1KFU7_9CAUD|nr:hypothetical protein lb338_phage_187 [Lactobacillus phage Lb338-1]ACO37108.1 unknown [Lactobacillus phage Lb338-1]